MPFEPVPRSFRLPPIKTIFIKAPFLFLISAYTSHWRPVGQRPA
jgi:hypothetical protein